MKIIVSKQGWTDYSIPLVESQDDNLGSEVFILNGVEFAHLEHHGKLHLNVNNLMKALKVKKP